MSYNKLMIKIYDNVKHNCPLNYVIILHKKSSHLKKFNLQKCYCSLINSYNQVQYLAVTSIRVTHLISKYTINFSKFNQSINQLLLYLKKKIQLTQLKLCAPSNYIVHNLRIVFMTQLDFHSLLILNHLVL